MTSGADWDATRYHRVAQPHAAWGANVLDRLRLAGDELVLDAGCGSGRVTAQLLERLPRGRVVAADHSPAMLAEARNTLAAYAERVTFLQTDLLDIAEALQATQVDVIFSTAVFHWIADHPRLFVALRQVLEPGGRLVSQFGGGTNLQRFMRAADAVASREPFASRLDGKALWRYYATPEETEARLLQAGFKDPRAWLEPSPQTFADPTALADFCRGVVLSNHMAVLPDNLRQAFADQVVDEIAQREGRLSLDYVRLNVDASG
jgi:trans-aconitate 2-methyltransferase